MRVLVLIPYLYGYAPGPRTSIELWEKLLNSNGIKLDFVPFETERLHKVLYQKGYLFSKSIEMIRSYVKRIQLLFHIDDYDAVFVYREAALIGPAWLEKWIARRKPIIYQLDDPLYIPYVSGSNGYFSYLKCFDKVAEICKMSAAVIVNSAFHKQFALKYNKNVWQIPSIVDTHRHVYHPQSLDTKELGIGWIGSPSTMDNLKIVSRPLQELAKTVRFKFHMIGAGEFDLPGVDYVNHEWREETETELLKKIQIGIAPLLMTEWNKRKFIYKVVQYMAMGIPPICTPLGSNLEVSVPHERYWQKDILKDPYILLHNWERQVMLHFPLAPNYHNHILI